MKYNKEELLVEAFSHRHTMECFAYSLTKNWTAAEDIFQETLVIAGNRWEDFKAGTSMFAWLRQIVWYRSMAFLEQRKKQNSVSFDIIQPIIEKELSEWDFHDSDNFQSRLAVLRDCMKNLPKQAKGLLCEYYSKGHSCKDIAQENNLSLSATKDRLYRLRLRLRNCISSKVSQESNLEYEHEELFEAYCNDTISEEETVALKNILETEPVERDALLSYFAERAAFAIVSKELLEETEEVSSGGGILENVNVSPAISDSSKLVKLVPIAKDNRFPVHKAFVGIGVVAACLIVAIGILNINSKQSAAGGLYVTAAKGAVNYTIEDSLGVVSLAAGSEVEPGATLELFEGSEVTLSLNGDWTSIELLENSVFKVLKNDSESGGLRMLLRKGTLNAKIDRQSVGAPLVFNTPHAEITILGTRFRLEVSATRSSIEMFEGRVTFKNIKTDEEVLVRQGFVASVANNKIRTEPQKRTEKRISVSEVEDFLIASYDFEEGEGLDIRDSHNKKGSGILINIDSSQCWSESISGKAVISHATDSSQRIRLRAIPIESMREELSISMLFKPIEVRGKIHLAYSWGRNQTGLGKPIGWQFSYSELENELRFNVGTEAVEENDVASSDPSVQIIKNEWNKVAVTYREGLVRFYINGEPAGEKMLDTKIFDYSSDPIPAIVLLRAQGNGSFHAGIDEVKIWNRAVEF